MVERKGFSRRRLAGLAGAAGLGAVTSGWEPANAATERPFGAQRGGGSGRPNLLYSGATGTSPKRPTDLAALRAAWETIDATLVPYPP